MTTEIFKKGQIVPKRLGILDVHKKSRHQFVWNCDVEVSLSKNEDGRYVLKPINPDDYAIINCTHQYVYRRMNNGSKKKGTAKFKNIQWVAKNKGVINVPHTNEGVN